MKHIITFLISLSSFIFLYAQPCVKQYAAYLEPGSKLISCDINQTVELTSNGVIYIQKIYHLDTKVMTNFMSFGDSQLKVKQGIHKEYYDDGTLESEGKYQWNKKEGEWLESKDIHVNYKNDMRIGQLKKINENGVVLVEKNYTTGGVLNGSWIERDANGNITEEKRYINGVQEFLSTEGFDSELNHMAYHGSCNKEKMTIQEKEQCTGSKIHDMNISFGKMALRKLGPKVVGNIKYEFTVDIDGQVTDIKIHRSVSKEVYDEVYKSLSNMPKWSPTLKNGSPVKYTYSMNIPLRFIMKKNEVLDPLPKRVLISGSN